MTDVLFNFIVFRFGIINLFGSINRLSFIISNNFCFADSRSSFYLMFSISLISLWFLKRYNALNLLVDSINKMFQSTVHCVTYLCLPHFNRLLLYCELWALECPGQPVYFLISTLGHSSQSTVKSSLLCPGRLDFIFSVNFYIFGHLDPSFLAPGYVFIFCQAHQMYRRTTKRRTDVNKHHNVK